MHAKTSFAALLLRTALRFLPALLVLSLVQAREPDGADQVFAAAKRDNAANRVGGGFPGGGGGWVTAPMEAEGVQFRTFSSRAVGEEVSYHVFLPPAYEEQPDRRFPVIYWLHGLGPGINGIPFISRFYGDAMASGEMPPAIIVFANGLPRGMWCDSKDGSTPVESMLIRDLIPHIDRTYRTIASREGRMLEGFSMGGYGAARLGLKYPEMFRGFSMLGAGPLQLDFLEDRPGLQPLGMRQQLLDDVYGGDMDYFRAQSPWMQAKLSRGKLPKDFKIRMVIGAEDSSRDNNRALSEHLLSLGIKHEYIEVPGVQHEPIGTLSGSRNAAFYRAALPSP